MSETLKRITVEVWQPIAGASTYAVSNRGSVRRLDHWRLNKGTRQLMLGRILTPQITIDGYLQVSVKFDDGHRKMMSVHRLVAIAFLGEPAADREVNHKDGLKTNNAIENLEFVTRSENIRHAYATGINGGCRGQQQPMAKFTDSDIREIRSLRGKVRQADLARRFNTVQATISRVQLGKSWRHVT